MASGFLKAGRSTRCAHTVLVHLADIGFALFSAFRCLSCHPMWYWIGGSNRCYFTKVSSVSGGMIHVGTCNMLDALSHSLVFYSILVPVRAQTSIIHGSPSRYVDDSVEK